MARSSGKRAQTRRRGRGPKNNLRGVAASAGWRGRRARAPAKFGRRPPKRRSAKSQSVAGHPAGSHRRAAGSWRPRQSGSAHLHRPWCPSRPFGSIRVKCFFGFDRSELGQELTFIQHRPGPLCPKKRASAAAAPTSAKGAATGLMHRGQTVRLFDHLIGPQQKRSWNIESLT
jgi:hypothetical protein